METAALFGVPLSVLRGERHPGDRWTDHDTDMAIALHEYKASLCPGCGHPLWESMDPANQDDWHAPFPARCHACTAIEARVDSYMKLQNVRQPRALRFHAERRHRTPQDATSQEWAARQPQDRPIT